MKSTFRALVLFILVSISSGFAAIYDLRAADAADPVVAPPVHAVVPAFERLYGDDQNHDQAWLAEGGRLLLGELGCSQCHATDKTLERHFITRRGPRLTEVGSRVKPEWLRRYLSDPQQAKPGTVMPHVLAHLPADERARHVESLVHFLVSTTGTPPIDVIPDRSAAERGSKLFGQIGCLACHDNPDDKKSLATSIPLGNLAEKYSYPALYKFLLDPHAVRPSGRMPKLILADQEASDLAHHFLRSVSGRPNLKAEIFTKRVNRLDEMADLKPSKTVETVGFDLEAAGRKHDFALRFTGYLRILAKSKFEFYLASDDGSRLSIDGVRVVDNDGIHPRQVKTGTMILDRGMHELVVDYFNAGGGHELDLALEGKELPRGDITGMLSISRDSEPLALDESRFKVDPAQAARGRELFVSVGCANCHELKSGDKAIDSTLKPAPLAAAAAERGCLARDPSGSAPRYALGDRQRNALRAALATEPPQSTAEQLSIARTLGAFNCYACHARDGRGGVEAARDDDFQGTIKEMGDEGRLPPALTGVGAKLTKDWLKRVLSDGTVLINKAKTRPYMHTRMPQFALGDVEQLVKAIKLADAQPPYEVPTIDEPEYQTKDQGRMLAGNRGFSCIKCHTFDKFKAEGIQSIDMSMMTRRLERDWFFRYVRDPQSFRPGTRMPSAWPKTGKSLLGGMYDGDSDKQIAALWTYLGDGPKARPPQGVGGQPIELIAKDEPIVYRNFIEGAGPRAIAVGYPEKLNLAFDANQLRLALVWQGSFIDASRHWSGRGEGFQPPLGDRVIPLVAGTQLAVLDASDAPWPAAQLRADDSQFLGYRLDAARRPTFLYRVGQVQVEDAPLPIVNETSKQIKRTLKLDASAAVANLWFRAVVAQDIEPLADGWYRIDKTWRMRIESGGASPVIRPLTGGKYELLAPVVFASKSATLVQTFEW